MAPVFYSAAGAEEQLLGSSCLYVCSCSVCLASGSVMAILLFHLENSLGFGMIINPLYQALPMCK